MELITRTVYGAQLQTCLLLSLPLVIQANTTLNEKFGVLPTTAIATTDKPAMKYIAIGNGGHKTVTGAEGISAPYPIQHNPTDATLFKHMPFILRDITNDITGSERVNYALRRVETHDGKPYVAYYLKRLDYADVVAKLTFKTVLNDVTTTTDFIPNSSNLEPVQPALTNTGVNVTTGSYISATAKVPFVLTEGEIKELLDAATIIYGNDNLAIISEIALCSGVDKVVAVGAGSPNPFSMNEAIGVQVVSFISTFFSCKFDNAGISVLLDCGASEPLFSLTNP